MKIALGLGCDRNTPTETLRLALTAALTISRTRIEDVVAVGSIDLKADEPAMLELAAVDVPNPSETVRKYTGTPSVSEAAALLAAGADKSALIIEKLSHRGPDGRNATVSIARIPE